MTTVAINPTVQELGVKLHLTGEGESLMQNNPEAMASFVRMAIYESLHPREQPLAKFIGEGMDARVVEVPEYPDLCVKTSNPFTGRKFHENGARCRPKNLITEMYFMDKVRKLMIKRDCGIYVPTLYAACHLPGRTTSMLIETLPEHSTPLEPVSIRDKKLYKSISEKLIRRVSLAFGSNPLFSGVGDFEPDRGFVHINNAQLEPSLDPEGKLYLIDLIGNRTIRASILSQTPRRFTKTNLPAAYLK